MTRIMTPTPTRGLAPSHSPPDVRYAPGIGMAKALGWLSIGLGAAELLCAAAGGTSDRSTQPPLSESLRAS